MSRVLTVLALGAVLVAGAPVRARQEQQPTFRAGVELVGVDVSVRERGRPVTGLQAKDFEVSDNGVPQSVIDVSYEKLPIDVTVALDVSASVTGFVLDQMRRAVGQLRGDLGAGDRLKVLSFNMRVKRLIDFSDNGAAADAALGQVRAFGSTSLLDTLAVSLVTPAQADRRQLVVVFSDGIDSGSVTSPSTVVELAQHGTATLAFVLPVVSPTPSATVTGRELYTELASVTGGLVVQLQPRADLAPTFRRVLDEFRASYVLHFAPKGVAHGGLHALDVRVHHSGADVRARKGYGSR